MSTPVRLRPRFAAGDAVRIARDLYGIEAEARELASERDQNFLLVCADGSRRVLKLSNGGEHRDLLVLQGELLRRLEERGSRFRFPRVLPTRGGETVGETAADDGGRHLVRLLTFLPGVPLAEVRPHSPALLREVGELLGTLSAALAGFEHPAAERELKWDLRRAPELIRARLPLLTAPPRRALVERHLERLEAWLPAQTAGLRRSVVHNDGNDYNILAGELEEEPAGWPRRRVEALLDFGDLLRGWTVGELAVGAAYAMLGKPDPLAAAREVSRGFHRVFALREDEIAAIFPLACLRLCLTVCNAAEQQVEDPENPYLAISEEPAWALLGRLAELSPELACCALRQACGLAPSPAAAPVEAWLRRGRFAPVVEPPLTPGRALVFDLSIASPELGDGAPGEFDAAALAERLFGRMRRAGAAVGIGRYDEARWWYGGELFAVEGNERPQRRTIHLGVDLFLEPGAPVFAPLAGQVASVRDNAGHLDYGPTVILEHRPAEGVRFYTLYGHLTTESLADLSPGAGVSAGQRIGRVGDAPANGGWPPHLHFQVIVDLLGRDGDFPGVARPGERDIWLGLCPDPNLVLGMPEAMLVAPHPGKGDLVERRRRILAPSLSISYRRPLEIVRGHRQHLFDEHGQAFLDAVNNVAHVGHAHPRVVAAAHLQDTLLNTNTRYLHENLVRYAERLVATLPEPLAVCFFVCSGSEANELALRLARAHTGRRDVVVVAGGYHGNTSALIDLSPYKHDGPGGSGAPDWVHVAPMPDPYRGPFRGLTLKTGERYAETVGEACRRAPERGGVAAFFVEPLLGCGGQIVPPPGYLSAAFAQVRAAGGVCVADEVQIGFGRTGVRFWAFDIDGAVPDIVTLGKPIGNGYPLAAVVTTREIAGSFANGMEYFNTFGGNPVACAVGLAVLEVLEQEGLQENARRVGERLLADLSELGSRHRLIGDVRGVGLFVGVELVRDRATLEPATAEADYVVNRLRDAGVLISTDGPLRNVLKIKPPICFSSADAERLVAALDRVLGEDYPRAAAGERA